MKTIRVLGIGSPFGDDQLGWKVIDALLNEVSYKIYMPHFLQFKKLDRPGISLLSELQGNQTVILIDAVVSDGDVGKIHHLHHHEFILLHHQTSSHHLSIIDALSLGKALNILPERIMIYGIEIDSKNLNDQLSIKVSLSLNQLVNTVHRQIRKLLEDDVY